MKEVKVLVITEEIRTISQKAPFIPITTVSEDGHPHLIVVGKVKEIRAEDIIAFNIYKMEKTQENIAATGDMQAIIAAYDEKPIGYRLSGKSCVKDNEVLLKVEKIESLI